MARETGDADIVLQRIEKIGRGNVLREKQERPRDEDKRKIARCKALHETHRRGGQGHAGEPGRPASKATASRVGDRAAAHESEHRGDGTKRDDEPELLHFSRGIDCFDLQGNRDLLNPVEGRVKRKRRRQEQCKQSPDAGPCLRIGPQTAHRSIKSFVPSFRRCLTLVSNCLACHVGLRKCLRLNIGFLTCGLRPSASRRQECAPASAPGAARRAPAARRQRRRHPVQPSARRRRRGRVRQGLRARP